MRGRRGDKQLPLSEEVSGNSYPFNSCERFSAERSTEHSAESQVRTPNFGSTHSCKATQIPRNPNPHRMSCVIALLLPRLLPQLLDLYITFLQRFPVVCTTNTRNGQTLLVQRET